MLLLAALRYGSLHDFGTVINSYQTVGRQVGVTAGVARAAILRFHANGNKYLCKKLGRQSQSCPAQTQIQITSQDMLE